MINASYTQKIVGLLLGAGLCALFMLGNVSEFFGSQIALFSLTSGVLPMLAPFAGLPLMILFILARMALRAFLHPVVSFKLLAFYVPGMVASAAWLEQYKSVRFFVPLVCMLLFVAHPVGGSAWLYAMYWLIPMALYLSNHESLFASSLSSTLVAHAVGSTIWLYADPMAPAVWLALIPIVAVERLLFAGSMMAAYSVMVQAQKKGTQFLATLQRSISAMSERMHA